MVFDFYGQFLSNFRSALLTTLTPIEQVSNLPLQAYNWAKKDFTYQNQLEKELQQLRTENLLLKAENLKVAHLNQQIKDLNSLLGTASKVAKTHRLSLANVIAYSSQPYTHFYKINKGSLDGIAPNQPVMDSEGIIGQIINITPTSSRVQLITDPDNQVPVRIQRTGQRGILSGQGSRQLKLNFIPNTSSLKVGDLIITSGLGQVYPTGYPIAEITQFHPQTNQPYALIEARPLSKLEQADKVLILMPHSSKKDHDQ